MLFDSREENQRALDEIARILKPGCVCVLVLPAFETIIHLRQLRIEAARIESGDAQAARVERAFNHLRAPDGSTASYSDDGVTRQYFHSRETIAAEVPGAGLDIIEGPDEFYYPWEVTRSYNYGYYPGKKETWDWIVVGRKPLPAPMEQP